MKYETLPVVDLTQIEAGTKLTKIVAIDEGQPGGDFTVELHGFIDEARNIYITNEIITYPEKAALASEGGEK